MNFSFLYFYPRHPRHNLGRQACSSHLEAFQIGQSPFSSSCQIFVLFLGRLCKRFDIFVSDPVRAILGVYQFLYLNSNVSLIINPPKCVQKRILKNHFLKAMKILHLDAPPPPPPPYLSLSLSLEELTLCQYFASPVCYSFRLRLTTYIT